MLANPVDRAGRCRGRFLVDLDTGSQRVPRQHDDPIEVDAGVVLQQVYQHCGARRSIAFAKQIFRRVPALVFCEKRRNESGKSVGVLVDAKKRFVFVGTGNPAEPGAGGINEDEIAGVEQALIVIHQTIRGRRGMRVICGFDPLRSKGSHMQPQGRGSRTAVEQKRDRPSGRFTSSFKISHIKHSRPGSWMLRVVIAIALDGGISCVIPVFRVHHQSAGDGTIVDLCTANGDRTVAPRVSPFGPGRCGVIIGSCGLRQRMFGGGCRTLRNRRWRPLLGNGRQREAQAKSDKRQQRRDERASRRPEYVLRISDRHGPS